MLYILTAPSGAGKTTIVDRLLAAGEFVRPITHTTRQPRPGEVDGVHYHFTSRDGFLQLIERGDMLEHADVYGNMYGTSRAAIREAQDTNLDRHTLLIVDVQGAATIRSKMPCVLIFIAPPSPEELERRLRSRGQDDEEAIRRRLSEASSEMSNIGMFDHIVVNDQLEDAIAEIMGVVHADEAVQIPAVSE